MTLYWTDKRDRKWPVCACQQAWLTAYQDECLRLGIVKESIDLYQTIGGAKASGGTHTKGGATDFAQVSTAAVRLARDMGADASWHRPKNWDGRGGGEHHHSVLRGCPHMVPVAGYQYTSTKYGVDHGHNGLANGAKDTGPLPLSKRTWEQGIAWAKAQAAAAAKPPAKVVPTWNQPETWKVGGVSADVKRLAERLVVHGFEPFYGNGTDTTFTAGEDQAAVKAFQKSQGWSGSDADGSDADGFPGMQTFALLEADPVTSAPDPTPAVTKPALRAARAAGAAPAKIPSSMSKMYHVASNVWYAVEDSIYGLEAAEAGGYPWADIDIHVTKDGVMVCGHDTSPSDDHFVLSAAMKKKYGSHPNIENMTWADVSTLRTPPVKFGGKTITLRYYKVDEILAWMGEHLKVSVSLEMKQSKAFENPKTFEDLRDRAIEHGVDPKRLAVMSIIRSEYNHVARFGAAHPYFPTIALLHDLAKPTNWASVQPNVDYYRGGWA